jgi:hypothetical protein
MTRLVWGEESARRYEYGIDRGVLFPSDGPGVVWNGLVNVEESFVGGEVTSFHFDGIKYLDTVSPKNYQATITAFSAPEEFAPCVGDKSVIPGFVLTRQPRNRFGFSYRTGYGNDLGYKLHLVYNATASPTGKAYSSINASPSAESLSWKIDAVPPVATTYRPSAHYVLDSTKVSASALEAVETLLYGSAKLTSRLPLVEELLDLMSIWTPLIIIPQSVTGLSQLTAGSGDLYKTKVDGINRALPNTRLTTSPTSGFYRME